MGFHMIPSTAFLLLALCCLVGGAARGAQALPSGGGSVSGGAGARGSGLVLAPRGGRYRARLAQGPPDRFVIEDDDIIELSKKQLDDYGHMRFGKREDQFDDYGHLRRPSVDYAI